MTQNTIDFLEDILNVKQGEITLDIIKAGVEIARGLQAVNEEFLDTYIELEEIESTMEEGQIL